MINNAYSATNVVTGPRTARIALGKHENLHSGLVTKLAIKPDVATTTQKNETTGLLHAVFRSLATQNECCRRVLGHRGTWDVAKVPGDKNARSHERTVLRDTERDTVMLKK